MPHIDIPYLRHMLDAVERLQKYLEGVTSEKFEADEVLQDAVIRQFEILGEAASRVSPVMPHAHFVRGPSPVTVGVGDASKRESASGKHLTVLPAAHKTLEDMT